MTNNDTTIKKETFQEITKEQMRLIHGGHYEGWPSQWTVPPVDSDD